jgi:hypothetical protein
MALLFLIFNFIWASRFVVLSCPSPARRFAPIAGGFASIPLAKKVGKSLGMCGKFCIFVLLNKF